MGKHDDIQSELDRFASALLAVVDLFEELDAAYARRDQKAFKSILGVFRGLAPKVDSLHSSSGRMIVQAIDSDGPTQEIAALDDRRGEIAHHTMVFFSGVQESFARLVATDLKFARKVGL